MKKKLQKNDRRLALGRTKWQDKNHIKHNKYDREPHYLSTPYLQGRSRGIRNPFVKFAELVRKARANE